MRDWNDLRYFLAVSRAGSIAGAARETKVDPATVARRLATLEESLGTRLFDRTSDGFVITATGEAILDDARSVEETLHAIAHRVTGADTRLEGVVRLTTSDTYGPGFLLPRLLSLHERHPGITLEVVAGASQMNLLKREADLAVRLGPRARPEQQNLVGRKLGDVSFALFASRDYLARRGSPSLADHFAGHDLVGFEEELAHIPPARWLAENATSGRYVLRSNHILSIAEAAAAGLGLAVLPCFLAASRPALERALPGTVASTEIWLVVHPDLQRTARVRAVIDFLVELHERERAVLLGA